MSTKTTASSFSNTEHNVEYVTRLLVEKITGRFRTNEQTPAPYDLSASVIAQYVRAAFESLIPELVIPTYRWTAVNSGRLSYTTRGDTVPRSPLGAIESPSDQWVDPPRVAFALNYRIEEIAEIEEVERFVTESMVKRGLLPDVSAHFARAAVEYTRKRRL